MGKIKLDGTGGSVSLATNNPTTDFMLILPNASEAVPIMRLETAKSATGAFVDFPIPSWAKKITVMFDGVSTNGTSAVQVQLGTSSGIENSGYSGSSASIGTNVPNTTAGFNYTAGFAVYGNAATWSRKGILSIIKISGNSFLASGTFGNPEANSCDYTAGSKTLSSTLDRIRITTVNGTDLMDAGVIGLLIEGY